MMPTFDELLDALDTPDVATNPDRDISRIAPDLPLEEAYRLQFALQKRRAQKTNDEVIGYQASFTSRAVQKAFPNMPAPIFGTLLRSNWQRNLEPIRLLHPRYALECEIGVLLRKDLAGDDVTLAEAWGSIEAFFPAIELAVSRPASPEGKLTCSPQHLIASHNTGSTILVGSKLTPPTIDVRLEGVVVSVNGEVRGSAAGVEAMDHPLNVVLALVRNLAKHGAGLRAGQYVITGSLAPAAAIRPGDREARAEFTRLGEVAVRFAQ